MDYQLIHKPLIVVDNFCKKVFKTAFPKFGKAIFTDKMCNFIQKYVKFLIFGENTAFYKYSYAKIVDNRDQTFVYIVG